MELGNPGVAGQGGSRQDRPDRMGAGSPLGAAQSLSVLLWRRRPWRRRRRQVAAWRSVWAPGRVLRGRPCLTRAERTKRSGPVCARGSSRGGSGGPGARRWPLVIFLVLVFPQRSAEERSASRRPHLRASAADTSAAWAATAGVHLALPSWPPSTRPGPAWLGPQCTPRSLCRSPGSARSYTACQVPAPRHTYTHAHSHLSRRPFARGKY